MTDKTHEEDDGEVSEIQKDLDRAARHAEWMAHGESDRTMHYLEAILNLEEFFDIHDLDKACKEIGAEVEFFPYDKKNFSYPVDICFEEDLNIDPVFKRWMEIYGTKKISADYEPLYGSPLLDQKPVDKELFLLSIDRLSIYISKLNENISRQNADYVRSFIVAMGYTDAQCEFKKRTWGSLGFDKEAMLSEIRAFWSLEIDEWVAECKRRENRAESVRVGINPRLDRDEEIWAFWRQW